MFKLHIYNPEHDIVLGRNDVSFTPPRVARITRERFCHIPAFWADDDDWILVDDVKMAAENLLREKRKYAKVRFVTFDDLKSLTSDMMPAKVEPWGWDKHLVYRLLKCNPLFRELVPDDNQLDEIREFSSRVFAAENLLSALVAESDMFVGKAEVFKGSVQDLCVYLKDKGPVVLKSPWSCSGRGVRFIEKELTDSERGWVKNILDEQKTIMIEPKYNKVLDFAMEFVCDKTGVRYTGMNLFSTNNGAYLQNSNLSEVERITKIGQYIDVKLLDIIRNSIIELTSNSICGHYEGPFGIDMMIVVDCENKTKVHPCVEMNLRRTMGQI